MPAGSGRTSIATGSATGASVRALPGQVGDDPRRMLRPTDATGYEAAGLATPAWHRPRPAHQRAAGGVAAARRCAGSLAAPNGRPFSRPAPEACATCSAVAQASPLRHPSIRPTSSPGSGRSSTRRSSSAWHRPRRCAGCTTTASRDHRSPPEDPGSPTIAPCSNATGSAPVEWIDVVDPSDDELAR